MRKAGQWLLIIALALSMAGSLAVSPVTAENPPAPLAQTTALAMVSPGSCPSGGCAAGQRLNMRFDFDPSGYDPAHNPNVKVCVYAPSAWAVSTATVTAAGTGELSRKPYTLPADPGCPQDSAPPVGYDLVVERVAQLDAGAFADALGFGFRLGAAGSGSGRVVARLFAQDAAGTWSRVQQANNASTLNVIAPQSTVYVANDAGVCGGTSPCYLNSAEDLAGGVGSGLKDAVDAVAPNSTITVLGNYTIKGNTVAVNKALTLDGQDDAAITYAGTGTCTGPMLSLQDGVTLRDLTINDGNCANPGRHLVEVNSPNPVQILSNSLLNGDNAIMIQDNTGSVTVRFNDITGNHGFAVFALNNAGGARLEITANNLNGNRPGMAVNCSAAATAPLDYRIANHNYWGGSAAPSAADTKCTLANGKRLGMPIALETGRPGVRARMVEVTDTKIYNTDLDSNIAYKRTGGSNFELMLVDHGYITAGGPPFTYTQGIDSPSPCSNYWDVFLPDGVHPTGTLELYFKYDRTAACLATINSVQYCDQSTDASRYPLYWFDPASGATKGWDTTGAKPENLTSGEGQATFCHIPDNEIQVSLDTSGRPNLLDDLGYTPFMVGVPVLKSFLPLASNNTITVTWTTNNEPDVSGFYVLRGTDAGNLSPLTDLITHTGTALVGKSYSFIDAGRANGVMYFYRLEIVRTDGSIIYSGISSIAANIATITPTPTITPTRTATPIRPTNTPLPTFIPTRLPTRIASATPLFRSATATPPGFTGLRTPTLDFRTPGMQFTATVLARTAAALRTLSAPGAALTGTLTTTVITPAATSETGTAVATLLTEIPTPLPSPTATALETAPEPSESGAPGSPWLSLAAGIFAGLAAVAAAGGLWYLLRIRK